MNLPYVVFSSNVGGQPDGATAPNAGTTQTYGTTPTTPMRTDIPWASLDGSVNTNGYNLAPGYAFDVAAGGFVGFTFKVQTYPGLTEWMAYDFEGLRSKLYAVRPDWKAQGLLDAGVSALDNISVGLTAKFLSPDPETHISKLEALSMPFRFDTLGAATPLTRDEFIADQVAHAKRLRQAILADASAPGSLAVLAADEAQWVQGWLAALEAWGLLRPVDEAPPIRLDTQVVSLNATLATGILLSKAGESYRTQADLLGSFSEVQQWYGDTARWAGDPMAAHAPVASVEERHDADGNQVFVPVPAAPNPVDYDLHAAQRARTSSVSTCLRASDPNSNTCGTSACSMKFRAGPAKLNSVAARFSVGACFRPIATGPACLCGFLRRPADFAGRRSRRASYFYALFSS